MKRSMMMGVKTFFVLSLFFVVSCGKDEVKDGTKTGITTDGKKSDAAVVKKFKVAFNTSGGDKIDDQMVEEGKMAKKPTTIPKKEGYTFIAWYGPDAVTKVATPWEVKPYDFEGTPINKDIEINAGLLINTLSISFDKNGGSVEIPEPDTTTKLSLEPEPNYISDQDFILDIADKVAALIRGQASKEGKPFKGFSLKKDASSEDHLIVKLRTPDANNPSPFEYNLSEKGKQNLAVLILNGNAAFGGLPADVYAAYY